MKKISFLLLSLSLSLLDSINKLVNLYSRSRFAFYSRLVGERLILIGKKKRKSINGRILFYLLVSIDAVNSCSHVSPFILSMVYKLVLAASYMATRQTD